MFEEAKLGELRKRLKDLETAKGAGYKVPEPLIESVRNAIREKEGIREVWACTQCSQHFDMFVRTTSMVCCGKAMKKEWEATMA